MKETIIKKSLNAQQFGNTDKSPRATQPITDKRLQTLQEALAEKDAIIKNLKEELKKLQSDYEELEQSNKEIEDKLTDYEEEDYGYANDLKDLEIENEELKEKIKVLEKEKKPKELTKIQGILTSNLRSKLSSQVEYMAFFRLEPEYEKHSSKECAKAKCQHCEIPLVFKIKSSEIIHKYCWTKGNCNNCQEEEIKPNLKKGQSVILEGKFEASKKSTRPSITCFSYKLVKDERSAWAFNKDDGSSKEL